MRWRFWRKPEPPWLEGWTEDGVHIVVDRDPYVSIWRGPLAVIKVAGVEVHMKTPLSLHVTRYRDGGTTKVQTFAGTLFCYRKLGREPYDQWTSLRGTPKRIHPFDPTKHPRDKQGRWLSRRT